MSAPANHTLAIVLACVGLALAIPMEAVGGPDVATIYEERCANCHGSDAGKLARETLVTTSGGRVVLKEDGSPLRELLDHHGRLRADEADALATYLGGLLAKPK